MQVQSCSFAFLTYCFLDVLVACVVVDLKFPISSFSDCVPDYIPRHAGQRPRGWTELSRTGTSLWVIQLLDFQRFYLTENTNKKLFHEVNRSFSWASRLLICYTASTLIG